MTSELRHHRYGRALTVGALSVALLSGGTAGAFAVSGTPTPSSPMASTPMASSPMASPTTGMAAITVKANKTSVKAGHTVVFTGRTKGLKVGSKLVLQHRKNGKWTSLMATTLVKKGSHYTLPAKLTTKGTEILRVASDHVYSPTVTVKVS